MNRSCIKIVRLPRVWLSLALVFVTCGFSRPASAFAPCCVITSIDTHTAIVAARETGTGKTFSFKVTNPSLLNSLKVGQGVYANFSKGQVSVDGFNPCCNIVNASGGTAVNSFGPIDGATAGKQFGPIDGAQGGKPLTPCCSITGIDPRMSTVTAKETATGKTFSFKATNPSLLNSLKVGQAVYANFATRQVSVDGLEPCCSITVGAH